MRERPFALAPNGALRTLARARALVASRMPASGHPLRRGEKCRRARCAADQRSALHPRRLACVASAGRQQCLSQGRPTRSLGRPCHDGSRPEVRLSLPTL